METEPELRRRRPASASCSIRWAKPSACVPDGVSEKPLELRTKSWAPTRRSSLAHAFTELDARPDSAEVLQQLRRRGLQLAPLANFSPRMIERLLGRAQLLDHFDALISTDQARTYKPDPKAYALAESVFGSTAWPNPAKS